MKILKFSVLFILFLIIADVYCGKLKLVAFKGPHAGFIGLKVRSPKLFGFKKHGLGFGHHGFGGFGGHGHKGFGGGGGGFHSSGYEHHEYHHSGGSFGGGGWFGK